MELVRIGILVVSTITMGLVAGLFYGFSISVMVTLRRTDDRTFVDVMQRINRDIQNGRFALSFIGTLLFTVLALVLFINAGKGSVALPLVVALACYAVNLGRTGSPTCPVSASSSRPGGPGGTPTARWRVPRPSARCAGPWSRTARSHTTWRRFTSLVTKSNIKSTACHRSVKTHGQHRPVHPERCPRTA
jgi:hypothetical protein